MVYLKYGTIAVKLCDKISCHYACMSSVINIFCVGLKRWGNYTSLSLTVFLPSPLLPHYLPLYSPFALEVGPLNTVGGSGGALHASQQGLGQRPSGNRIWCILALKSDI